MSYLYNCATCPTKCDGRSKGVYNFLSDLDYSKEYEKKIREKLNDCGYYAVETERDQYPDIEVYDREGGKLLCFLEVKAQRRTFMTIEKHLPYSGLLPSETVALNRSDLEHYIDQSDIEEAPIFIMWVVSNRPCITGEGTKFYYNHIDVFKGIFDHSGNVRQFRRSSGSGDVVDGVHKGVVVNYHFSLREMIPFTISSFMEHAHQINRDRHY